METCWFDRVFFDTGDGNGVESLTVEAVAWLAPNGNLDARLSRQPDDASGS
jgi:hypothetical protein